MVNMLVAAMLAQVSYLDSELFSKQVQLQATMSTVSITNKVLDRTGSGVIVGGKETSLFILTSNHVVDQAEEVEVTLFTAKHYPEPARRYSDAKVIARDSGPADLALIRLVSLDAEAQLPIGKALPIKTPISAFSVGCSGDKAPSVLAQKIEGEKSLRLKAGQDPGSFWEVKQPGDRGRSGGPLVYQNAVIGICSFTTKESSYFTSSTAIHRFVTASDQGWLLGQEKK